MRRTRYVGTIAVALLMALTAAVAGCGSGETTTTEAAETPTTAAETSTTMVEDTTTTTQVETVFQQAEKQSLATLGEIPTPSKTYKIGYLMITLQNPFWVTLGEGAKAAAAEYGMEISVQSAPTENDVTSQLNTLETMAGQDFDAIIVHTITADNLVPGIVTARKKGVLVVDADGRVNGMAVKAEGVELPQFNMIDFEKQGQLGAEYIIAKVGSGEGKVAIIEGLAGAPQSDARAAGAKKAFEAAGFKVVASQPGNWDRTTALNVATNILQANPDLVGFYAANDVMALAASEAVSQAGKAGKVVIVGTDFIEDAKAAIQEGRMDASVAFSPYIVGELAVAGTLKLLEGQDVPADFKVVNMVIDKDNVGLMSDWK